MFNVFFLILFVCLFLRWVFICLSLFCNFSLKVRYHAVELLNFGKEKNIFEITRAHKFTLTHNLCTHTGTKTGLVAMINENDESSGSRYMLRSKTLENPKIQHNPENEMFSMKLGTSKAFITYTKFTDENIIQMDHTEVPKMYNGKGYGKLLAKVCAFLW